MPKTKKRVDRYKAVSRGAVYCSPDCGRGCTKKEYDQAQKRGRKLAKRLTKKPGPGKWAVKVHENLGWHYSAVSPCGRISVTELRYQCVGKVFGYSAYLGEAGTLAGTWVGDGNTPAEAVSSAIQVATEERDALQELLQGLET